MNPRYSKNLAVLQIIYGILVLVLTGFILMLLIYSVAEPHVSFYNDVTFPYNTVVFLFIITGLMLFPGIFQIAVGSVSLKQRQNPLKPLAVVSIVLIITASIPLSVLLGKLIYFLYSCVDTSEISAGKDAGIGFALFFGSIFTAVFTSIVALCMTIPLSIVTLIKRIHN